MKKLIKNLILFLVLIMCQNAFCYTLSEAQLNKIIYSQIDAQTKEFLNDTEYKLNIHATLSNVITNDLEAPKVEISSVSSFSPNSYRRVIVRDLKGNIVKSFPINVNIFVYKDVLTATKTISLGEKIDDTNTKLERREVSKIYDKVLTSIPESYISARNITKGLIIQKNSIKQKALIEKNQSVDIVFLGKGVQITLRGKALKEGAFGDMIPVRSDKYNKIYSATVDSNSKVTIRI